MQWDRSSNHHVTISPFWQRAKFHVPWAGSPHLVSMSPRQRDALDLLEHIHACRSTPLNDSFKTWYTGVADDRQGHQTLQNMKHYKSSQGLKVPTIPYITVSSFMSGSSEMSNLDAGNFKAEGADTDLKKTPSSRLAARSAVAPGTRPVSPSRLSTHSDLVCMSAVILKKFA